mgnify:CR=1 FL=1
MNETPPELIAPCLDAEDGRALAAFWQQFLRLPYRPGQGPDDDPNFIVIDDPAGTPKLAVQQVESLPRVTWPDGNIAQQIHLDLLVRTPEQQRRQLERAAELGASVLDDRSDDATDPLVVMADPAGHPFCLICPPRL